jgi:hypothetical protein
MAKQRTEQQMLQSRINRVKAIEAKPSTNLSEAEMVQYRVERVKALQKATKPVQTKPKPVKVKKFPGGNKNPLRKTH